MKNLTVLQQLVSKQISVKTLRTPIKSGKCISCLLGDSCLVKEQNMTQPLLKSSDNSTVDSLLIPFHLKLCMNLQAFYYITFKICTYMLVLMYTHTCNIICLCMHEFTHVHKHRYKCGNAHLCREVSIFPRSSPCY